MSKLRCDVGFFLKSKSRVFKVRDGKGFKCPMKNVGLEPVWFENLSVEDYLNDSDLEVVVDSKVVQKTDTTKPEPKSEPKTESKPKRRGISL